MIAVEHVSYAYGSRVVLSDVSFTVGDGEFLGLLGPNSSGKSTLLRLITGERALPSGRVTLLQKPIDTWSLRDLAQTIAVVPAENHFAFPFVVEHIVLMGRTPHRPHGWRDSDHDRAVARAAMESTDTWALRERRISELSSGERQRVLLARALTQEPTVLVLDEPTAHLDIGHEGSFFDLLQRLRREKQLTVICALHDLAMAARACDRLALLNRGRLHALGRPRDVLTVESLRDVYGVTSRVQWAPAATELTLTFYSTPKELP